MKNEWMVAVIAGALTACSAAGKGDGSESTAEKLQTCAPGPTVEGVDVSEFQGAIDWPRVRAAGPAFAFIRVSDGLQHSDATFDANWAGARGAGLMRGAYQFFRPDEDAVAQANLLLARMGTLEADDLPPTLDVEATDGVGPARLRAGVDAWSARISEATGRRPIVYVSPGFWPAVGGPAESDTLWVANWEAACPTLPSAWNAWAFWQYDDHGSVAGVPAPVDRDRFNGSLEQLHALATPPPPPPPLSAPTECAIMHPNEQLVRGATLLSCDGRFELAMQGDGNLVLYGPGGALWATGTDGTAGDHAVMQVDGNFVLYTASGQPLWSSGTAGAPGDYLAVQNDGNLVVYAPGWSAAWSSGTCCH